MIRIYGCGNASHRSMIKRFVESAGTKLPTDLRIVVDYHRRRRSGIVELRGWKIYRTGSKSVICSVDFLANDVRWIKRGREQRSFFLTDYIGYYSVEEYLELPPTLQKIGEKVEVIN